MVVNVTVMEHTWKPDIAAPLSMTAMQSQTTDMVGLQPVKASPKIAKAGPTCPTVFMIFLVIVKVNPKGFLWISMSTTLPLPIPNKSKSR